MNEPAGIAVVERLFRSGRSLDDYAACFAEDAVYRFGNAPPIRAACLATCGPKYMKKTINRAAINK